MNGMNGMKDWDFDREQRIKNDPQEEREKSKMLLRREMK
jgi:hypothetical protein